MQLWLRGDKIESSLIEDLILSICTSLLNLCINMYRFRKDAKFHGMDIVEYALSVLQLCEIPIIKLVPRLPAIRKGLIDKVNFSSFYFDRESFAPLLLALKQRECELKTVKISIGSLKNLDDESCKLLGRLLFESKIDILVSRNVDRLQIQSLFNSIDTDGNGYLDEKEFTDAIANVNTFMNGLNMRQQKR